MTIRKWIVVSGMIWLAIGCWLMVKGLKWITAALVAPGSMLEWLAKMAGSLQQGGLLLICAALLVGFIKGRMVLSKSVDRVVAHLRAQKEPIPSSKVYDRKYYIIIGSMMGLGMVLRFLPIPFEVRGAVDVTIGSALINGAMLYFRAAVARPC